MFYGIILYLYPTNSNNQPIVNIKQNINNDKLQELKSKITTKDDNYVIKLIEDKSEKFNVKIYHISSLKKIVEIKFNGRFIAVMDYLNYLQNHWKIVEFKLIKNKLDINCNIKLDIKYFYNQNKIYTKLSSIANPFVNNKAIVALKKDIISKVLNTKSDRIIKIIAIIDSNILVNNQWYKKDDIINNQKILSIGINDIEIQDLRTNKIYITKVYDENK